MIIAGNKIYEDCDYCGKLVQINKSVFGSLHICLHPEHRRQIDEIRYITQLQKNYKSETLSSLKPTQGE